MYARWRDATGYHAKFYHQNEEGQWGLVEDQVVYEGVSPKEPALELPEGHRIWEYYEDAAMEQTYDLAKTLQEDVDIYVKSGGLGFFKETASLKNGKKLSVSLGYRDYADYDGRKHVLNVNPANGKVQNPTAALNPDIEAEDFTVALDGKKVKGITLKSCTYKNNINPGDMQLIPTVAYDGKNEELKRLLTENKDLKTTLGKLLKPSYNKTEDEWSSEPIMITICEIQLTEKTPVYNLLGMTKEQKAELAKKDEVLVWNGKQEKITWAKRSEKGEETAWNEDGEPTRWGPSITYFISVKVEVPNLYYQRVFNLGKDKNGNDKLITKKIRLRAGGWTTQKVSDDGEIEVIPAKGVCDYYCVEPDWSGYEKGDMPSKIELKVNQDGRKYIKMKRVAHREDDGEGHYYTEYSYEEDQEIEYAPGFFYGTMPDIVYPQ